jgi:hypothetical protein
MVAPLAFSPYGHEAEVVRLADGRLAERSFDRRGRAGWLVYSHLMVREAFFTDAQWARVAR